MFLPGERYPKTLPHGSNSKADALIGEQVTYSRSWVNRAGKDGFGMANLQPLDKRTLSAMVTLFLPFSRMDSHLHYARATTAFTTADRLIRTEKDRKAVRDIWIFLASVLAFFTLVNLVRKLSTKLHHPQRSSPPASPSDVEKTEARLPGKQLASRLTRVSSAVATSFRIVAFRWAIPIGPNALATVSELACICLYIAANLLWLFLDSTYTLLQRFSGMTGVSHEKLNVLHRAAGRTMFLMLWIHTIGRAVSGLPPKVQYHDYFMQAGIIGLAALTAGVFLSVRIFRQALFEFFFVTHIAFMLMFLIGGYIHLHEQGYDFYIWPSLLVWGLDRLFRALRLLWHNTFRLNESAKSQAIAELLTEDTIRLTFKRKFHWKPGQHAYVSLPKISRLPSEAHPFTIASLPGNPDGTQSEENSVVFLIRTRSGVTRRLREFVSKTATNSVAAYRGSGISYTLPLLLDLIRQSSIGGKSEVRRVLFVWVVRGDGHLPWITETLSKALSGSKQALDVEVRLYVTRANVAPGCMAKNEVFPEPESSGNAPHIHHGRPDITTLLHDEISASSGPVSVDVAGPGALTASVREALSTGVASPGAVLKGTASVTLHVETFGMIQS
ncbi:hypothetical protein DFP72DRAFT_878622 [Ephemerocybe angulata]|uniref:ferric-chelate reductase (NADPH) n=1 Tax=Ephemerocybe angulata TaxID=980116 RepID=A0A8H6IB97_9AGAR|nr:hypothetical protein DFP72DRAFT_878622 [Tulosesus angulatus]